MSREQLLLSAIDTASPLAVASLARALENLGYHRLWVTEHYSPQQSASPTVVTAVVAATTRRMRVGSGGVMLRYANAMRVATDFHLMEALFPGRIDVGVIGNRAPDPVDLRLRSNPSDGDEFPGKFAELASCLRERSDGVASIRGLKPPALWLCGVSPGSAQLAASHGAGFAFGAYMSQFSRKPDLASAIAIYRDAFAAATPDATPRVLVSCFGACAATADEAERLWAPVRPATPSFLGTPEQCREQLQAIATRYDAEEIMVQCYGEAPNARIEAYEALAVACAVVPPQSERSAVAGST